MSQQTQSYQLGNWLDYICRRGLVWQPCYRETETSTASSTQLHLPRTRLETFVISSLWIWIWISRQTSNLNVRCFLPCTLCVKRAFLKRKKSQALFFKLHIFLIIKIGAEGHKNGHEHESCSGVWLKAVWKENITCYKWTLAYFGMSPFSSSLVVVWAGFCAPATALGSLSNKWPLTKSSSPHCMLWMINRAQMGVSLRAKGCGEG